MKVTSSAKEQWITNSLNPNLSNRLEMDGIRAKVEMHTFVTYTKATVVS